jgi:hypothetical protein
MNEMIEVTYFEGKYTEPQEKQYTGECAAVIATIDMADHIQKSGWCMVTYKNKSCIVSNINQLGL